jgi:large subunit ribosomal protein L19
MNELIESVERRQSRKLPGFREGDRVRVHFQVIEGTRKRTQVFEGVVLKLQGAGVRRTFAVRKVSFGVGVERTFPLHSPKIEQVEVIGRGEVRRAKLYYLRGRIGRRAKVRERTNLTPEEIAEMGQVAAADDELTEADAAAEVAENGAAETDSGEDQAEAEAGGADDGEADGGGADAQAKDAEEASDESQG